MLLRQLSSSSGKFDLKYFVALLFGGIVASGIWWYFPREPASMAFTYRVSEVVTARGPEAERFEIKWRGRRVSNAVLVLVRLRNDGGRPLRKGDFDPPLTLALQRGATVVEAGLDSASRKDLRPRITDLDGLITLEPVTFDVGDWLVVRLLLANCVVQPAQPPVALRGHIAGVREYVLRRDSPVMARPPRSGKVERAVIAGLSATVATLLSLGMLVVSLLYRVTRASSEERLQHEAERDRRDAEWLKALQSEGERLTETKKAAEDLQTRLRETQAVAIERERRLAELETVLSQNNALIAESRAALSERDRRIAQLEAERADIEFRMGAASAEVEQLRKRADELRAQLAELPGRLSDSLAEALLKELKKRGMV